MARRATYLQTVRDQVHPKRLLLFAGTNEFVRKGGAAPRPIALQAMRESLEEFHYDLGLLTQEEAEHFQSSKDHWPKSFLVTDQVHYRQFKTETGTVGVIAFPELNGAKIPSPKMIRSIETLVKKKRKETDLLVGLSPWGYWGEQAYLKSQPNNGVDLLLGSGPGVEVTGALMAHGDIMWNRAYSRGKHVLRIDIDSWPADTSPKWIENKNIHAQSVVLTDGYVEDTHIFSIIGKALN